MAIHTYTHSLTHTYSFPDKIYNFRKEIFTKEWRRSRPMTIATQPLHSWTKGWSTIYFLPPEKDRGGWQARNGLTQQFGPDLVFMNFLECLCVKKTDL